MDTIVRGSVSTRKDGPDRTLTVILQPKDYQRWLSPENEDVADILAPPSSAGMIAYPVGRRVNSPKNDDSKLIEPERV